MLSDVISKSYEELKRGLKTEVDGRKGRHKPAIQGRKPKSTEKHQFSLPLFMT